MNKFKPWAQKETLLSIIITILECASIAFYSLGCSERLSELFLGVFQQYKLYNIKSHGLDSVMSPFTDSEMVNLERYVSIYSDTDTDANVHSKRLLTCLQIRTQICQHGVLA